MQGGYIQKDLGSSLANSGKRGQEVEFFLSSSTIGLVGPTLFIYLFNLFMCAGVASAGNFLPGISLGRLSHEEDPRKERSEGEAKRSENVK